jgi:hypothetical protein
MRERRKAPSNGAVTRRWRTIEAAALTSKVLPMMLAIGLLVGLLSFDPTPSPASTDMHGQPVRIPSAKGPTDKNGPDYTQTATTPLSIPRSFALDGKLNIITVWKADVAGLGPTAIVYFRPVAKTVTDTALNVQVAKIWARFHPSVSKSDLVVFIIRGVNSQSTKTYSFIFRVDATGKWTRNRDADFVDSVIQTGI